MNITKSEKLIPLVDSLVNASYALSRVALGLMINKEDSLTMYIS